jgi:hypothetical protein
VRDHLVSKWATLETTVLPGQFKDGVQALFDLQQSAGKYDSTDVAKFTHALRIQQPDDADVRIEEMPKEWRKVLAHYEMLKFVNMGEYDSAWVKAVVNYVNLMDK